MNVSIIGLIMNLLKEDIKGVITQVKPLNSVGGVNPCPTFKVDVMVIDVDEIRNRHYIAGIDLDFVGTEIVLTKRFVREVKEGE